VSYSQEFPVYVAKVVSYFASVYGAFFITRQDFVENSLKFTSETKEWQTNHTKTLDNLVISLIPISDSAKATLFEHYYTEFLPLSSVQSNRAVFFQIARLYHTGAL
jgi:hypothetical protein